MVARIAPTAKLSKVLEYNEKKVAQNKAELIYAGNYLQAKNRLTYEQKLERLTRQNDLNDRSRVKTLHITLNFHPSEKLSDDQLTAITDRYMQGLKMENQPYLVYRHEDAGHPHVHIITSLVRPDGKSIRTSKIGQDLSSPTRKAIEKEFNLIPAQGKKQQTQQQSTSGETQKVMYGSDPDTQEAVRKVLETVNHDYRFTNLTEYNAVLRQYNVYANTGSPGSNTRKHGGLLYQVLDEKGNRVGRPLKASQFPSKPTLVSLEQKFGQNKQQREKDLPSMRQKIDWVFTQHPGSLRDFIAELQQSDVEVITNQEHGRINSLTYIDYQRKTAIQDAALGKAYGVGAILNRIPGNPGSSHSAGKQQAPVQEQATTQGLDKERNISPDLSLTSGFNSKVPQFLSALIQSESVSGTSPRELDEDQEIKRHRKR